MRFDQPSGFNNDQQYCVCGATAHYCQRVHWPSVCSTYSRKLGGLVSLSEIGGLVVDNAPHAGLMLHSLFE